MDASYMVKNLQCLPRCTEGPFGFMTGELNLHFSISTLLMPSVCHFQLSLDRKPSRFGCFGWFILWVYQPWPLLLLGTFYIVWVYLLKLSAIRWLHICTINPGASLYHTKVYLVLYLNETKGTVTSISDEKQMRLYWSFVLSEITLLELSDYPFVFFCIQISLPNE